MVQSLEKDAGETPYAARRYELRQMQTEERYHYSVLFVRTEKQSEIARVLSEQFPRERGKVFLPMWEYWRRDKKEIALKALFPGYIFLKTDMEIDELRVFLRTFSHWLNTYIRQLGFDKEKASQDQGGEEYITDFKLLDLTDEEAHYLDLMLDEEGVERMSYGYCDPKVVVMEGPLVAFADRILKRNKHERIAWLDLSFRDMAVKAGLTIRPKEDYFPDHRSGKKAKRKASGSSRGGIAAPDSGMAPLKAETNTSRDDTDIEKDESEILSDGTRINLQELTGKMMGGQTVYRTRH